MTTYSKARPRALWLLTVPLAACLLLLTASTAGAVKPMFAPGYMHTLILRSDGTLWSTGFNTYGELGLGDQLDRSTLSQVTPANDWSYAYGGAYFSLALKQDGTLWAWGTNTLTASWAMGPRPCARLPC